MNTKYLAGFVLFLAGLTVASWYASRVVEPTELSGVDAEGEPQATAGDRISAWGNVAGAPFGVGFVLMLAGGFLARSATSKNDEGEESSGAESSGSSLEQLQAMKGSLAALSSEVLGLDDGIEELAEGDIGIIETNATKLADKIEAILEEQIPTFLERREELVSRLGLEDFAEMIGHFATFERATARAWSALTDEAWAEVPPSLVKAIGGIDNAETVAAKHLLVSPDAAKSF